MNTTPSHPVHHQDYCECTPSQHFVCSKCGRLVGYCMGTDDDEQCDDCWYQWYNSLKLSKTNSTPRREEEK